MKKSETFSVITSCRKQREERWKEPREKWSGKSWKSFFTSQTKRTSEKCKIFKASSRLMKKRLPSLCSLHISSRCKWAFDSSMKRAKDGAGKTCPELATIKSERIYQVNLQYTFFCRGKLNRTIRLKCIPRRSPHREENK